MAALNSPEFYADRDTAKVTAANERLAALERELDMAYERWDELEQLSAKYSG